MDQDLARPVRAEALERRVRLLRDSVAALDPGGSEEAAYDLGLRLARDRRDRDALVHASSVLRRDRNICS